MRRRTYDGSSMFVSVRAAAELSGLSQKYVRQGCREKRIPFVMVGSDYRVNWELWREQLNRESRGA